jgi:hypothetical protein
MFEIDASLCTGKKRSSTVHGGHHNEGAVSAVVRYRCACRLW